MLRRGRYFGFYVSGENKGQVQEADSAIYHVARISHELPSYEVYSEDSPAVIAPAYNVEQWYHNKAAIGNREYGIWTPTPRPDQEVFTEAILTLIDMDPAQARMCETHPRRF